MKKFIITRPLLVTDILQWADAYYQALGKWPARHSGGIVGTVGETWAGVDRALREGRRGLPGGSSLALFLAAERQVRHIHDLPQLTVEQVLRWADEHRQRTGTWPTAAVGIIPAGGKETWASINAALRLGTRGLAGGSSLPRLLAQQRGVRNRKALPPLTEEQILAWADDHHQRTGSWPRRASGAVLAAPGETWMAVEMALNHGQRGLPGGSTLALLLAGKRGARHIWNLRRLSLEQILAWADAHKERTGAWPQTTTGPIAEAPGETWNAVNHALQRGSRGLAGRSSLARLLAAQRGVRNPAALDRLTRKQILRWADAHHRRTVAGQPCTQARSPTLRARRGTPSMQPWPPARAVYAEGRPWLGSCIATSANPTSATCRRCRRIRFSGGPTRITSARAAGRTSIQARSLKRRQNAGGTSTATCTPAGAACAVGRRWPGCSPGSAGFAIPCRCRPCPKSRSSAGPTSTSPEPANSPGTIPAGSATRPVNAGAASITLSARAGADWQADRPWRSSWPAQHRSAAMSPMLNSSRRPETPAEEYGRHSTMTWQPVT